METTKKKYSLYQSMRLTDIFRDSTKRSDVTSIPKTSCSIKAAKFCSISITSAYSKFKRTLK